MIWSERYIFVLLILFVLLTLPVKLSLRFIIYLVYSILCERYSVNEIMITILMQVVWLFEHWLNQWQYTFTFSIDVFFPVSPTRQQEFLKLVEHLSFSLGSVLFIIWVLYFLFVCFVFVMCVVACVSGFPILRFSLTFIFYWVFLSCYYRTTRLLTTCNYTIFYKANTQWIIYLFCVHIIQ